MIVNGLTEILTKASEGDKLIFCYPGLVDCFEANAFYGIDGITEKVSWGVLLKNVRIFLIYLLRVSFIVKCTSLFAL